MFTRKRVAVENVLPNVLLVEVNSAGFTAAAAPRSPDGGQGSNTSFGATLEDALKELQHKLSGDTGAGANPQSGTLLLQAPAETAYSVPLPSGLAQASPLQSAPAESGAQAIDVTTASAALPLLRQTLPRNATLALNSMQSNAEATSLGDDNGAPLSQAELPLLFAAETSQSAIALTETPARDSSDTMTVLPAQPATQEKETAISENEAGGWADVDAPGENPVHPDWQAMLKNAMPPPETPVQTVLKTVQSAAEPAGFAAPSHLPGTHDTAPIAKPPVVDIKPALHSEAWEQAVAKHIVVMAKDGMQNAHLRLNPPNLGAIDVKVVINQDQASVSFFTAHGQVREALEAALPRLREMFGEQGLHLQHADVTSQQWQGQKQGTPREGEPDRVHNPVADYSELDQPLNEPMQPGRYGLIDIFA